MLLSLPKPAAQAAFDVASDPLQNEDRLHALSSYNIVETGRIDRFDRIARLIHDVLGLPCVSINVVDGSKIWRKGWHGLPDLEVVLAESFAYWCLHADRSLVLADVASEPRFASHPYVTGSPHVRSYAGLPLRNAAGWALGVLGVWDLVPRRFTQKELRQLAEFGEIIIDEIELRRALVTSASAQRELASREQLLSGMFDNAAIGIAINRLDGSRVAVNDRMSELLGWPKEELLRMSMWDHVHPEDLIEDRWLLSRLVAGERTSVTREKRIRRRDGSVHWVQVYAGLVRDEAGRPQHIIMTYSSIDERKQAEFARNLLVGEINHRVKNTLAIIQGMAKQMQRSVQTPAAFSAAFEERLQALSNSHDMLTRSNWKPLRLDEVIEAEIASVAEMHRARIVVGCPQVPLKSQVAVLLGLVVHELMTNAIKYGALSTSEGLVDITAHVEGSETTSMLSIVWEERGGPPVATAPVRRGFGQFMLERGVRLGLSGESSLAFEPTGLVYRCRLPLLD